MSGHLCSGASFDASERARSLSELEGGGCTLGCLPLSITRSRQSFIERVHAGGYAWSLPWSCRYPIVYLRMGFTAMSSRLNDMHIFMTSANGINQGRVTPFQTAAPASSRLRTPLCFTVPYPLSAYNDPSTKQHSACRGPIDGTAWLRRVKWRSKEKISTSHPIVAPERQRQQGSTVSSSKTSHSLHIPVAGHCRLKCCGVAF